jgi:methionine sulfoxide reductase heme-binding subunit
MESKAQSRFKQRFVHHVTLSLVSIVLLGSLYYTSKSPDPTFKWSMSTAYVSLLLLGITLITGPVNLLLKRRNPVSTDLRRDIGIWSGIIGLAHVAIGWQVHMGNMLLYFFKEEKTTNELMLRSDLFGFANYTGLAGALILVLLLALSNDLSLRKLKAPQWKYWQRWNYVFYLLVIIHAIAYQVIEKREVPYPLLLTILILPVLVFQVIGYYRYKDKNVKEKKAHDYIK